MSKTMQQKAADAHNMCRLKGDSLLDNRNRQISFEAVYNSEDEAQQAVEFFTQKAKSVETDPCEIETEINPIEDGFLIKMWIEFSCEAEVILFQMAVR